MTQATVAVTVLSFGNFHEHGSLFTDTLRARKKTFIDKLHWDLPQTMGMEFDQYDTPFSRWVTITVDGIVKAGMRITPTRAQVMAYSYMLRDAQRGLLDSMPRDILYEPAPVDTKTWEVSRNFVLDDLPDDQQAEIRRILVEETVKAAQAEGAERLIGIMPIYWPRWSRRYGIPMHAVGPRLDLDGPCQAVMMDISGHTTADNTHQPLAA